MSQVSMRQIGLAAVGALALLASSDASAASRKKHKRVEPAAQLACERATYVGDPVCDLGAGESKNLPLPSSRMLRKAEDSSGFLHNDRVSVDGKTNFNDNRFGDAPLHKFHLKTQRKDANGGAQLDYKF